jgi:hypothetical protein
MGTCCAHSEREESLHVHIVCVRVTSGERRRPRRQAYARSVQPLEEHYNFPFFFSPVLNAADIEAKPFVLLLGQYSVGKTTFINHLLGAPSGYPGSVVGPEPTTDGFVAIMHGDHERVLPGNVAAASGHKARIFKNTRHSGFM